MIVFTNPKMGKTSNVASPNYNAFVFSAMTIMLANSQTSNALSTQMPLQFHLHTPLPHREASYRFSHQHRMTSTIQEYDLSKLSSCKTGTAARKVLDQALLPKDNDDTNTSPKPLYKSLSIPPGASDRPLSDADLAIQTNIRNAKFSIMDLIELNGDKDADRASLALLCIMVGSSFSAIVSQQYLPGPEIVRFAVVWLLSFSPLIFAGYGLATPSELQSLLVSIQRNVFPTYRKRMIHHEAGHFLMGHLLGMPIRGYRANAVKNAVEFYPLSDSDVGMDRAAQLGFDAKKSGADSNRDEYVNASGGGGGGGSYFGEGGRGEGMMSEQSVFRNAKNYSENPFLKLPAKDEPTLSWPYRGFDHQTLDLLSAVSVAGVCAEILAFGNAEGGYADMSQLNQLLRAGTPELNDRDVDNRIRYALGFAMGQLRRHLGALDALVEAMERDASVEECVRVIESCENVSGATVVGNYERIRRDKIRKEGVGFVEQLLLGGGKNLDVEDNSVIEGKGGGDRKKKFQMTGDDPFYAAIATAVVFFVWASSGGLSLH